MNIYSNEITENTEINLNNDKLLKNACKAIRSGRWTEGWIFLNKMTNLLESAPAQYNIALCYEATGNLDKAIACLEQTEKNLKRDVNEKPLLLQGDMVISLLNIENTVPDSYPMDNFDFSIPEYAFVKVLMTKFRIEFEARKWKEAANTAERLQPYKLPIIIQMNMEVENRIAH